MARTKKQITPATYHLLGVRVEERLFQKLKNIAIKTNESVSTVVREILRNSTRDPGAELRAEGNKPMKENQ